MTHPRSLARASPRRKRAARRSSRRLVVARQIERGRRRAMKRAEPWANVSICSCVRVPLIRQNMPKRACSGVFFPYVASGDHGRPVEDGAPARPRPPLHPTISSVRQAGPARRDQQTCARGLLRTPRRCRADVDPDHGAATAAVATAFFGARVPILMHLTAPDYTGGASSARVASLRYASAEAHAVTDAITDKSSSSSAASPTSTPC